MQPASPSVGRTAALRGAFAMVLALLVAAVVDAQPPAAQPKEEKKDEKPPEPKWPTEIGGRNFATVVKELEDPDPVVREYAARHLPNFGPPAGKAAVSGLLVKRMTAEKDPGVRYAVFGAIGAITFENDEHNKEALTVLTRVVDEAGPGAASRYNAVQAIGMFATRGEPAITKLTGVAMTDPSYETRRAIAAALGKVGGNDSTGPNMKALVALADHLAKDSCAAVRMEALQSIMVLGPPWAAVKKPDDKNPPPIDAKSAAVIIAYMKARVGDPKLKRAGLEKDKQVEIWARMVLMRFDPAEINDDNLDALARYLTGAEIGVKIQALKAIGIMGELASKKLDAVVRLLSEKDQPRPLTAAVLEVLVAMRGGAKPALPDLKLLRADAQKSLDAAKRKETEKKAGTDQDAADQAAVARSIEENWVKFVDEVIKRVDDAKPLSPAAVEKKP